MHVFAWCNENKCFYTNENRRRNEESEGQNYERIMMMALKLINNGIYTIRLHRLAFCDATLNVQIETVIQC